MKVDKKNRKGWIKIVEAFIAIMLIASVILIVLNSGYLEKEDISKSIYSIEVSILREIQRNDSMREEILNVSEPLPVEWGDEDFPLSVRNKIIERTPTYLECIGKICNITDTCGLTEEKEQNIYAQCVAINPTIGSSEVYRKLNLFCWIE